MMFLVLAVCLLSGALGMTTQKPMHGHHGHNSHGTRPSHMPHGTKPTKMPHINENFYFQAIQNWLGVKHGRDCYIYEMNAQEQMDVKTSHGLHEIEKNIIDIVDMGVNGTPMSADQLQALNMKMAHFCGKHPIMKIN